MVTLNGTSHCELLCQMPSVPLPSNIPLKSQIFSFINFVEDRNPTHLNGKTPDACYNDTSTILRRRYLYQVHNFLIFFFCRDGPGKSKLQAGRSGDRIPVEARFSAPAQTSPGAHPASQTMGTGSFPGVTRPGRGVDHPPSSAEVKKEYSHTSTPPLGLHGLF